MARTIFKRASVDPAKLSGLYSLLAVMLSVAEIVFAIWFWKAEGSIERSIAGSVIASVFLSLMILVLKMNNSHKEREHYVAVLGF